MKFDKVMYNELDECSDDTYITYTRNFIEIDIRNNNQFLIINENIEIDDEFIKNEVNNIIKQNFYIEDGVLIIIYLGKGCYLYSNEKLWKMWYKAGGDKELSVSEYLVKSILE